MTQSTMNELVLDLDNGVHDFRDLVAELVASITRFDMTEDEQGMVLNIATTTRQLCNRVEQLMRTRQWMEGA